MGRPAGGAYDKQTIERALTCLILCMDNAAAAARQMKAEHDVTIQAVTITRWKKNHFDIYQKLREELGTEIEQEAVRNIRDRLSEADQAEKLAIEQTLKQLKKGQLDAKEASIAALNMTRVKKENIDKLMTLTGRAIEPKQEVSAEAVFADLVAKGILRSTN